MGGHHSRVLVACVVRMSVRMTGDQDFTRSENNTVRRCRLLGTVDGETSCTMHCLFSINNRTYTPTHIPETEDCFFSSGMAVGILGTWATFGSRSTDRRLCRAPGARVGGGLLADSSSGEGSEVGR